MTAPTLAALLLATGAAGADAQAHTQPGDLPPHAQHWYGIAMDWLDGQWQPEAGTCGDSIRMTAQYALALWLRDAAGDRARADAAMRTVLDAQWNAPGERWHGTYRRSLDEPDPPDPAMVWRHYDPNWRAFIGTQQALALHAFPERIAPELRTDMEAALRLAAEGALARDVGAHYTNISMMVAWLLADCGVRFDSPRWRMAGRDKAEAIVRLYNTHDTVSEYNSPTYAGVSIYGAALWRALPPVPEMAEWGAQLERGQWRDLAMHYHAGLKNLAGPWDRSYAMDMMKTVSLAGFWPAFFVAPEHAPVPLPGAGKSFEFGALPGYAMLAKHPGEEVLQHFTAFRYPREVARFTGPPDVRPAQSYVGRDLLLGAGSTRRGRFAHDDDQDHPVTAHWRTPDGEVGWMRLHLRAAVAATLEGQTMDISVRTDRTPRNTDHIVFEVFAPGADPDAQTPAHWQLPGLEVEVAGLPDALEAEAEGGQLRLAYPIDAAMRRDATCILLRFRPTSAGAAAQ